jgi:hypothetical protein
MDDERPEERQATQAGIWPQSNVDDDIVLCAEAADLKATTSYQQIAARQGCSIETAWRRVRKWHQWLSRLDGIESMRSQLADRYEWITRQLIAQYNQVIEESKIGPAPHCGLHEKHEKGCAACKAIQEAVPVITPWGRVRMIRQILESIAEMTDRQARLYGLIQENGSARIDVSAYSYSSATPTRTLPRDPIEREKVMRLLRAVRKRTGDDEPDDRPKRLPG